MKVKAVVEVEISHNLFEHIIYLYKDKLNYSNKDILTLNEIDQVWKQWCFDNLQGDINVMEGSYEPRSI